ncbi:replication restart helicase PriA [Marinitoga litoralis]|uniref:replication restart helicase PriA n=1 Tax=Marinitoga litoralis TaxID=570855 RepID=UPI001961397D|nr:primosomal protein N' [Marinitoga litoralis]MBM7559554.1 primosomal protein N' (replication factor Y) [Marinitoga litoralis]
MYYYETAVFGTYTYTTFTYSYDEKLRIGQRVLVDFRNQQKLGVILSETTKKEYEVKDIELIIDNEPLINEKHIEIIKKASKKFLMPISEIAKLVFPPNSSDRIRIKIIPKSPIFEKEIFLDEYYRNFKTKREANKKLKELIKNNIVELKVHFKKVIEKKDNYIILKKEITDILNDKLSSSAMKVINYIIANNNRIKEDELYDNKIISKSSTVLKTLLKKEIIEIKEEEEKEEFFVELTDKQNEIKNEILKSNNSIDLLYGVTGSGKTEIFFEVMEEYLKKNKKILIIIPEISLTPQFVFRVKRRFNNKNVGIYHSNINSSERTNTWYKAINGEIDILIGTRSAIWIPINNLGTIIIDEEHDQSLYQFDQISYDAVEVGVLRSKIENVKLILSSATPTLREMKKSFDKEINFLELKERVFTEMPEIEVLDMKKEEKLSWIFAKRTLEEINNVLKNNEKALIFSPTKGYANYLICTNCGNVLKCENCDVSYTYHRYENKLKCHYCGDEKRVPNACPVCGNPELQLRGYGTERVVNELLKFFPNRKIIRMDREIIKSYEDLNLSMEELRKEGPCIIVGTKIITKGLDVQDIKLVVVLDSDRYLNFPEYTSHEHTASLLIQVAGRSGRKEQGKVIIQTFKSESEFFKFVKEHDYDNIIEMELNNRKKYNYPPYSDLIIFIFSNAKEEIALKNSTDFYDLLENESLNAEILEPTEPLIPKLRGEYRYQVIVKGNVDKEKFYNIISRYSKKMYVYVNPPTTLL